MQTTRFNLTAFLVCLAIPIAVSRTTRAQPPVDADWKANAAVEGLRIASDPQLGAAQGVSFYRDHLYFYGDVYDAKPRVGIVREYTLGLKPTGRDIRLTRHDKPVLVHPTGLCWDAELGCFLGDTVNKVATIYKLDWERALKDGNLDAAVLAEIRDDAAVNGCRPEYVTLDGRRLLATADYGDVRPAVRLYDPRRLVAARRSSAPGVLVATIPCGPFNQNLFWDGVKGELTCVQNVVAGLGWKLDVFNLEKAVAAGKLGAGPRADARLPPAQRDGGLAAAARRPRGIRHLQPAEQHLRRQEPFRRFVRHAARHMGVHAGRGRGVRADDRKT